MIRLIVPGVNGIGWLSTLSMWRRCRRTGAGNIWRTHWRSPDAAQRARPDRRDDEDRVWSPQAGTDALGIDPTAGVAVGIQDAPLLPERPYVFYWSRQGPTQLMVNFRGLAH